MKPIILIVDDEPLGLATLESHLDGEAYRVETAQNGKDALAKADAPMQARHLRNKHKTQPCARIFTRETRIQLNKRFEEARQILLRYANP